MQHNHTERSRRSDPIRLNNCSRAHHSDRPRTGFHSPKGPFSPIPLWCPFLSILCVNTLASIHKKAIETRESHKTWPTTTTTSCGFCNPSAMRSRPSARAVLPPAAFFDHFIYEEAYTVWRFAEPYTRQTNATTSNMYALCACTLSHGFISVYRGSLRSLALSRSFSLR